CHSGELRASPPRECQRRLRSEIIFVYLVASNPCCRQGYCTRACVFQETSARNLCRIRSRQNNQPTIILSCGSFVFMTIDGSFQIMNTVPGKTHALHTLHTVSQGEIGKALLGDVHQNNSRAMPRIRTEKTT